MRIFLAVLLYSSLLGAEVDAKIYLGDTHISSATKDHVSFIGMTKLKNSSFQGITVVGPLSFLNIEVKNNAEIIGKTDNSQNGKFGKLFITGTFNASNIQCNQLKGVGFFEINNLHVKGKTDISGYLSVHEGFLNDIEIMGTEVQLDNVEANNILVKSDLLAPEAQQLLILSGNTLIKGNITFTNGNGVIMLSPNAKIMGQTKDAALQKFEN